MLAGKYRRSDYLLNKQKETEITFKLSVWKEQRREKLKELIETECKT